MKITDILEAFSMGKMSEIDDVDYQREYGKLLLSAIKIADVRQNLQLFKWNDHYLLVRNNKTILGNVRLLPVTIAGNNYYHVDGIFVSLPYRKGPALHWLLYAVKEVVNLPVVADGAIFADGQDLIAAIQDHKFFNVSMLNKNTGKKTPLTTPINSVDHCYLFETSKLGFGKQIFVEGLPYTWYPLFEEIK